MAQSKGGCVFLTVFGMVFLSVGVVVGYFSAQVLLRAESMRAWTETPARVVACDLKVSRGSKGSSSYCAAAEYQYEAGGQRHTGRRVSLYSGSDNIGGFQRRVYAELKRCKERKETIPCWVNPRDPSDAILIRKPRLEMLLFMQLFVLVFGGIGVSLVTAGLSGLVQQVTTAEPLAGPCQIRMNGTSSHRVAGVLALAWNGYVGWLLWQAQHAFVPDSLPWYVWLLAASGVIPGAFAAYLIGRYRKFGVSVFAMSPMPAVAGGPVAGTVRIPAKIDTEGGFEVMLRCVHQYTTGSGKQRHTHRDEVWQGTLRIDGSHAYGDEAMLPVHFDLPAGVPATTAAGGRNGYYWQLKVTAAAAGIDYKAEFDVPVRRT